MITPKRVDGGGDRRVEGLAGMAIEIAGRFGVPTVLLVWTLYILFDRGDKLITSISQSQAEMNQAFKAIITAHESQAKDVRRIADAVTGRPLVLSDAIPGASQAGAPTEARASLNLLNQIGD